MVFGDVFRQRGDYSKGLFYSGRNGIFDRNQKTDSAEMPQLINKGQFLSPRDNLMTNSTASNPTLTSDKPTADISAPTVSSVPNLYTNMLKIQPKRDNRADLEELRKKRRRQIGTIVIERPLEEWKVEEYGGVKVWVDNSTGEVSVNRPLEWKKKTENRQSIVGNLPSLRMFRKTNRIAVDGGTSQSKDNTGASIRSIRTSGRTVYHNQEMKELMEMFDAGKSTRRINSVIARKVAALK